MARFLYGVGRWAVAHRGRVVLAWLVLLAAAAGLGIALHGQLSTDFTVPGTESQNAQNLLQARFPAAAGGGVPKGACRAGAQNAPGRPVEAMRPF